jgi:inner membrane protein
MTGTTHLFAGMSTLWLLAVFPHTFPASSLPFLLVCASLGSLLPDLDAEHSTLKYVRIAGIQPFAAPSIVLHRTLGHRGLMHSLVGLGLMAAIVSPSAVLWGWRPILALVLGYASHLAADALTPSGIPLYYPSKRRVHLAPKRLRIATGSLAEALLFPLLTASVVLLLLYIGQSFVRPLVFV